MKFCKSNIQLFILIVFGSLINNIYGNNKQLFGGEENRAQSSGTNMDPFGFWSSTSGIIRKGIRMLRDNLQEGVKIAKMLKEDMNDGLSQIVSKKEQKFTGIPKSTTFNSTFDTASTSVEDISTEEEFTYSNDKKQLQREGMLGGILRLVGFDSNSIGIIVLNVLIFIAEMVTSSLMGKESNTIIDRRLLKTNIFEFLITGHNENLEHIFQEAQNKSLPENIIKLLQNKTGNKTSCVQLLLCKIKPFIWSIQKTFTDQITNSANINFNEKYLTSVWDQLNQILPSKNNFINYGNNCEIKYPVCQLLKFQEKNQSN